MVHLFWHLPKEEEMMIYPWLLWYIWKARNDKLFSNIDRDPREILRLAKAESTAWELAQRKGEVEHSHQQTQTPHLRSADELQCYVDGSLKEKVANAGLGWYCVGGNIGDTLLGAKNLRRSLSPLHAELEALIWAMHCMLNARRVVMAFFTDYADLVKMVSTPAECQLLHYNWRNMRQAGRSFLRSQSFKSHAIRIQEPIS